ncbi:MAG: hypothetical protein HWE22_00025 [Flavobacteriales bacterium]|nr:hypothetical protein [Flavobacteriales bacterium]
MRRVFFILVLLNAYTSFGQVDKFKYHFDLSFGFVQYNKDKIENSGYGFSSVQWNDTVHSLNFDHNYKTYLGLNAVVHAGLHIPIVKGKMFSTGMRPKVGIGRLFQIAPSPRNHTDIYGYEEEDSDRITSVTLDATLCWYLRYNLFVNHFQRSHITLLAGYRFVNTHDNYKTPILSAEYGKENWSIGAYAHLFKMEYYRQYSTGAIDVAKSHYEWGLTLNLLLERKEKPKKEAKKN